MSCWSAVGIVICFVEGARDGSEVAQGDGVAAREVLGGVVSTRDAQGRGGVCEEFTRLRAEGWHDGGDVNGRKSRRGRMMMRIAKVVRVFFLLRTERFAGAWLRERDGVLIRGGGFVLGSRVRILSKENETGQVKSTKWAEGKKRGFSLLFYSFFLFDISFVFFFSLFLCLSFSFLSFFWTDLLFFWREKIKNKL